eukprot:TRINITY_DN3880_c0_g1_i2.p1 TRINITY_DN3880_c0_g1~~TRINITY_DN3880_c0_g1_i2.p1  ORF type:complete len:191 (+),score=33.97 TRINITY_DN3880_c0_g1_i2:578-1150(+)
MLWSLLQSTAAFGICCWCQRRHSQSVLIFFPSTVQCKKLAVQTYDAITAQLTRVFDGHKNGATVNSVEFSQAGTRLLSASDNTAVTLHDFATGAVLLKLKKKDIVNMVRVCFSCDERSIIAACLAHGMKIFSCETGGLLQSITCASPVYSVAVTPPPATFLVHAHARRRPDDASAAAQQRPTKRVRTART